MKENIPEDIALLKKEIEELKEKAAFNEVKEKKDVSSIPSGFNIVIELISGTIIGAGLGYILDELFDFKNIFLVIFTIFGGFAGILNAYRYVKTLNKEKEN